MSPCGLQQEPIKGEWSSPMLKCFLTPKGSFYMCSKHEKYSFLEKLCTYRQQPHAIHCFPEDLRSRSRSQSENHALYTLCTAKDGSEASQPYVVSTGDKI